MRQIIPLCLSVITVFQMWKAGDLKAYAWAVGLANQVLWLVFIIVFKAWGLLPLNGALVITYTRNLLKWKREAAVRGAEPS